MRYHSTDRHPLSLETPGRAEYRGPGLQEAFNEQG